MTTPTASTTPGPPRPSAWEVPDLALRPYFAITPPRLRDDISDRLLSALNSARINKDPTTRATVENFLRNIITFGNNEDWDAHRLLGKGGWGTVGLWVKKDSNDVIVDEVAVKHQEDKLAAPVNDMFYYEPLVPPMTGRLREAVINKQMNDYLCENILHMRGYHWITRQNLSDGIRAGPGIDSYRMYLEYSPNQTLQDLIDKYRAWDRLLPEAFLWHVFDSLAAALEILHRGPRHMFTSEVSLMGPRKPWTRGTSVVHFDIKPNNVFLGYEDLQNENVATGGSRVFGYPIVKLSDYGLAAITEADDPRNPGDYFWRGTTYYKPPEQNHYGVEWDTPPNGRRRNHLRNQAGQAPTVQQMQTLVQQDRNPGFFFSSAANVWNVGKIMYDLAVLSRSFQMEHTFLRQRNAEASYNNCGQHFINVNRWNSVPFMATQTGQPPQTPFSDELMDLIRDCLVPSIRQRVGPQALRVRTQRGLARAEYSLDPANAGQPVPTLPFVSKLQRTPTLQVPRVYYRENGINALQAGRATFAIADFDYKVLMDTTYADPDWEPLQLPASKWARVIARANMPQALQVNAPATNPHRVLNGRIQFNRSATPRPRPAATPATGGTTAQPPQQATTQRPVLQHSIPRRPIPRRNPPRGARPTAPGAGGRAAGNASSSSASN